MSAEKIIDPVVNEKILSGPVDINHLLARVRKQEKKEYKTNLVFFCLFSVLIVFVGILLSL
jgi:hypothetical protein